MAWKNLAQRSLTDGILMSMTNSKSLMRFMSFVIPSLKIMGSANLTCKIKRLFDLFLPINVAAALLVPICMVAIFVRVTSKGLSSVV